MSYCGHASPVDSLSRLALLKQWFALVQMRAEKAIWTREKEELNAEIKANVAQTLQTHKMRMGMCVWGLALAEGWLCVVALQGEPLAREQAFQTQRNDSLFAHLTQRRLFRHLWSWTPLHQRCEY